MKHAKGLTVEAVLFTGLVTVFLAAGLTAADQPKNTQTTPEQPTNQAVITQPNKEGPSPCHLANH